MENCTLDISQMSLGAIMRLTDAELGPIVSRGYWILYHKLLSDEGVAKQIEHVRWGHWVPGLNKTIPSDEHIDGLFGSDP